MRALTLTRRLRRLGGVVARTLAVVACASISFPALAGAVPERAAATVNQAIWLKLDAPGDQPKPLKRTLRLLDADELVGVASPAEPRRAEIAGDADRTDLAKLFTELWSAPSEKVKAVQLELDGKPIGAPVLLVPMVPAPYAPRVDRSGLPVFVPPQEPLKAFSGYWLLVDKQAVLTIDGVGDLTFRLRVDAAPRSVMAFRSLIERGFYDQTPIFRVASLRALPQPDFIQFGDPTGTGLGGPGILLDLEPSTLRQDFGVLSFARAQDPNSAGSQVILALSRAGVASLERRYTPFAELVGEKSAETIGKLAKTPVNDEGKPLKPVQITKITLVDAPPLGQGEKAAKDPASETGGGR